MRDVHVEPATSHEQLVHWVALRNALVAGWAVSVEDVLHQKTLTPHRVELRAFAGRAEVGGALAARLPGVGAVDAWANVWVTPDARRTGVGTALLVAASTHARAWGVSNLQGYIAEQEAGGLAFARRFAFRQAGRAVQVALELAAVPLLDPDPPPGVALTTLAERPDLLPQVYEIESEAAPDIPGAVPERVGTYEEWVAAQVETPTTRRDAWFIALDGDRAVGYAVLGFGAAAPDQAWHEMTAVRRSHRERGIGRALKRAQIRWAKEHGLTRLVTGNDEHNAPIRHLNESLGYRTALVRVLVRGPLVD